MASIINVSQPGSKNPESDSKFPFFQDHSARKLVVTRRTLGLHACLVREGSG